MVCLSCKYDNCRRGVYSYHLRPPLGGNIRAMGKKMTLKRKGKKGGQGRREREKKEGKGKEGKKEGRERKEGKGKEGKKRGKGKGRRE